MRRLLLMLGCLACGSLGALAQTLRAELSAGWPVALGGRLALENVAFGEGRIGLEAAFGASSPFAFSLEGRSTETFGPLGNLSLRARSRFDFGGGFETELSAQGVLGPVAGTLALALFARPARPVDPLELPLAAQDAFGLGSFGSRTRFRLLAPNAADLGLALELAASYRVSRTLIARLEPELYLSDERGFGLRFLGDARFVRALGGGDLWLRLSGMQAPGGDARHAALEVEARLADLRGALSLGAGSRGLWPGLALEFSAGALLFSLAAEPYRSDLAPYRGALELETPLGAGALRAALAARFGNEGNALRLGLGYSSSW